MANSSRKPGKKGSRSGRKRPASAAGDRKAPAPAKAAARGPGPWPGVALLVLGILATFLMMANDTQLPHGPLWGLLCLLVAAGGLLWVVGPRGDAGDATPIGKTALGQLEGEPLWMTPMVGVPLAIAVLVVGALAGGFDHLPWVIAAALICLLPASARRPGLLVVTVVGLIYLPRLGVGGLWDPWETHYGEVTREILARDDWISLWWAQEDWFWSKPILIFWSEAFSMGALGVNYLPDANPLHPEWAVRLPAVLFSLGALVAAYAAVKKVYGARAGALAALVMATMPHFFFLAHQAITDMFEVASTVIAMSLLVLALREDPERKVGHYAIGPLRLSGQHAVMAALFIAVVPQVLYLISRNVTLVDGSGFAWHGDTFLFGSAGNTGIPGNSPARDVSPYVDSIPFQPMAQGLFWLAGLVALMAMLWRERRARSLYMFGFYFFCALGFMGKGIPGFALPGLVALLFLIATRRWSLLTDGHLRVGAGILTIFVVGMPWYVAMYIRHGPGFTDRLLVHDHLNRLAVGVHGDTGSIQYFIEQMGFGTFPWVALLPAGVLLWLWYQHRYTDEASPAWRDQRDTSALLAAWFFAAFTLFSAMLTKFHHYIFPAEPPAAILIGVLLDRMFGKVEEGTRLRPVLGTVLAVVAPLFVVLGIAGTMGDVRGVVPVGIEGAQEADWVLDHPWSSYATWTLIILGILLAVAAWKLLGSDREDLSPTASRSLGGALVGGTVLAAFVGRDMSWVTSAHPQGYERLIQLFIYNYGRPWPEELDYRPVLTAFALIFGVLLALGVFRRVRPMASRALVGAALAFTAWTLNIYMVDLSPHWGQRELVKAYYEHRSGPEEPLVAWQMNWKGENFYTGNHVYVFVDLDNRKIREWIDQNRGRHVFFMFEHSRMGGFRGLLRGHEIHEVTDKRVCNKFILVEATL